MLPVLFRDALIFANLLTLLSIGLTLTFMTTKVPNFAHGDFATIGSFIALTVSTIWALSPYYSLPFSFVFGGFAALALYKIILKPLMTRGASIISLMIATFAYSSLLAGIINIYADYVTRTYKVWSRPFTLSPLDPEIFGHPGAFMSSTILAILLIGTLHLVLNKTKFGVAMRATVINPSLASVVGINTDLVYSVSWFLAGGLAGLAGVMLPLRWMCGPDTGPMILASIFAASIVGGISSVYGAILGGYLIGLSEMLGTYYLATWLGAWILPYRPIVPVIAIVIVLLTIRKGLVEIEVPKILRRLRRLAS